jgi:cytochrome c oxidase subunit II
MRTRLCMLLALLLHVSCERLQSPLTPASPQAHQILDLFTQFLTICVLVYLLVIGALMVAIVRTRRKPEASLASEKRATRFIHSGVVLTTLILIAMLLSDFITGRALAKSADADNPLQITVTGRQWWWQFRYENSNASRTLLTANELHLPVGRTAQLTLQSRDVIHSFWVPNLHGKKDAIPGHDATLYILPERQGTFTGQCAEYCGHQHAHMRFTVVVEPAASFDAWLDKQLEPAIRPQSSTAQKGQDLFLTRTCVMCHTIQGSGAMATVGPNLTHMASRQFIAAGSLPNERDRLGGWIVNPHQFKPGVRMPQHVFEPDDLNCLLDYLESLK